MSNATTVGGVSWRQEDRRRVALVTTTIHVPRLLGDMLENARRHGHLEQVGLVVVGDRKTPSEVGAYVADLGQSFGIRAVYLDGASQQQLLCRWPMLDLFVRYNSIQRRNVGFLQAALDRAEVIVSVDDDNFVTDDDFIGHHLAAGREIEVPVVSHASGWWNVCQQLATDPPRRFYHRGYPKSLQNWQFGGEETAVRRVKAVVNAGLWRETPDVDATAHCEEPIQVVDLLPLAGHRSFALACGTWCPFNSQNTSLDASILPAAWLPVMHDPVKGYRIDRFDDIWMSYFVRAIGDGRGETVAYGPPMVRQTRNPHNYVNDLAGELAGYLLTEWLVVQLRAFRTAAADWADAYLDLIYFLRDRSERDAKLEEAHREYLRLLLLGMAAWLDAIRDLRAA